jgi:hypothetical protein
MLRSREGSSKVAGINPAVVFANERRLGTLQPSCHDYICRSDRTGSVQQLWSDRTADRLLVDDAAARNRNQKIPERHAGSRQLAKDSRWSSMALTDPLQLAVIAVMAIVLLMWGPKKLPFGSGTRSPPPDRTTVTAPPWPLASVRPRTDTVAIRR